MNERDREFKQLNRERILSLSDLFEEILRKIWLIIILAIIFAVICAGYKYSSDRSKAQATTNSESYEKAQSALTDEERREVDSVLLLYDEVAAQEEYMENSILMSIDPYHEDRVVMQFAVQADIGVMTNALQAVDNYVTGGSLVTDLAKNYAEEDSVYLSELISYEEGTVAEEQADMESKEEGEEVVSTTAMFWVQVIHSDQASAERLADEVAKCIASFSEDLTSYFESCEINFLSQSVTQVYDSSLKNTQNTAVSDQITQQNKIVTQTDSLSEEQVDVLEAALADGADAAETVGGTTASESNTTQTTNKVHISARYTLVGIVIGIVVGIIVIVLYYIARRTLNIAPELSGELGLSVFGEVHETKQRNPLVRAWRRLVRKRKPLAPETERKVALMNLKTYLSDHQINRILVAGTRPNLSENGSIQEILTALRDSQIDAEIAAGLPDSPDALEKLRGYNEVLLVEFLHRSMYAEVVREIDLCMGQEKQIAGAIVID